MRRTSRFVALTAAAASTALAVGPAIAAPEVDPIAEDLAGPLQFQVSGNGTPFVAQSFMEPGTVSKVKADGTLRNVVVDESGTISGVAKRDKRYAYTLSGGFPSGIDSAEDLRVGVMGAAAGPYMLLKLQDANGDQSVLANLGRFEERRNPDRNQAYGFYDLSPECEAQLPPAGPETSFRDTYAGHVESNPHHVTAAPGGGWYVADAAANTILKVEDGRIELVHVVKPQVITITEEIATAAELPECTVGLEIGFEGVPTDIEVAPNGNLFVSLLPGGPEDPESGLPPRGAVIRVNPETGKTKEIASGFAGATNLALGPNRIWVAELFGGAVTQINTNTGNRRPLVELPLPAGVEYHDGSIYVSYGIFGPAAMVKVTP